MIPAGDSYHACPECGAVHAREEIMSGNTIGAKYYSDGKMEAPMFPDLPSVIRCARCALIFQLRHDMRISRPSDRTVQVYRANHLDLKGWKDVIGTRFNFDAGYELTYRVRLMWTYHDPLRHDLEMSDDLKGDREYVSNLLRLLELMDENDPEDLLFSAELNRLLGRFEHAWSILDQLIENDQLSKLGANILACQNALNREDSRIYQV